MVQDESAQAPAPAPASGVTKDDESVVHENFKFVYSCARIFKSSAADLFHPTNRQTKLAFLPDPKHMQQQGSVRVDDLQSYAAQKFKYHSQYQHWGMLWRHAVFTIVLCVYLTYPLHTHIAFDIENGLRDALVEV